MIIEIHPGTGGVDAEQFAQELTSAIIKGTESTLVETGRVVAIEGPQCL